MDTARRSLSILVVDDSTDAARSTAELLAIYGHTVQVALGGEEALQIVAATPPDVVLLDIRMPGLDGYEVARRITTMTAQKPPLLVALTGCGSEQDCERINAAGFHLHLLKPVEPDVLLSVLQRFARLLAPPTPA